MLETRIMHEKLVQSDESPCLNSFTVEAVTPNWTINVSDIRTLKIMNISPASSVKNIKEFLSFSGDIQYVELRRETEMSQVAYITFKDAQGADTALGLAGSTIADLPVMITPVENYQLPPDAPPLNPDPQSTAIRKAEDMVSTVLAKGLVIGKGVVNKAKSLDERHHLTSNASATISSINNKLGLSEKISSVTNAVNEKVREIDEKLQVSEKTKTAFSVAEQKAGAVISNQLLSTGTSRFPNAYNAVARAAEDVSSMTKDKVGKVEGEKKAEVLSYHRNSSSVVNQDYNDHVKVGHDKKLEII